MKKKLNLLAAACLMFTATGCVFHSYQPTAVYDLEPSVPELKGETSYQVLEFRNNSGAGKYMLLKSADGSVEALQGSRWLSEPGMLVSRGLNRVLLPDAQTPETVITGTLDAFVAEPDAHRFLLSGTFTKNEKMHSFQISVPLKGEDDADIVKAANLAVSELAKRIAGTR